MCYAYLPWIFIFYQRVFMGIKSGTKKFFKPLVDVPSWIGFGQLKERTGYIASVIKNIFTIDKPSESKETFDEAARRLHLDEAALSKRQKGLQRLLIIYFILNLAVAIYLIYSLWQSAWLASMASFGILAVLLGQLFRYHFWLFQLRQRRLGCTFREWLNGLVGRAK